jgi:4-hydroxybenzoyl-CoA thioesterase
LTNAKPAVPRPFATRALVRFAHVDAAGIVFYPRYLEIISAAIEDFFAIGLGADFNSLHLQRQISIPTVDLRCEFSAPSRLGDLLDMDVSVVRLGNASMSLRVAGRSAAEPRFMYNSVVVCLDMQTRRSQAWPADLRAALLPWCTPASDAS